MYVAGGPCELTAAAAYAYLDPQPQTRGGGRCVCVWGGAGPNAGLGDVVRPRPTRTL